MLRGPCADASPDNSCLYMLPRPFDPGYIDGDDDASEVDPLPLALDCKQAYQNIRAIPAEAGSAVMFTHRIIHWGSKGRPVRPPLSSNPCLTSPPSPLLRPRAGLGLVQGTRPYVAHGACFWES
eukprot:4702342-Pyramimonas_sp.AAC.1